MELLDSLLVALRGALPRTSCAGLTMLGMIIGVGAVIALMAVGKGAQESVTQPDPQAWAPTCSSSAPAPSARTASPPRPGTAADADLRGRQGHRRTRAYRSRRWRPRARRRSRSSRLRQNTRTRVTGTTPEYAAVRNFQVAEGEFITQQNVDSESLVAVLGSNTAKNALPRPDPVGPDVVNTAARVAARLHLRVIGVMESKGSQAMGNQDDVVYVPITTLQQRLSIQRSRGGRAERLHHQRPGREREPDATGACSRSATCCASATG